MTQGPHSVSAWPDAKAPAPSRSKQRIVVTALAAAAALGVGLALPASAFRTRAVVGVSEVGSPLSAILTRTATEAAVSKSVMMRAAESLIGTGFPAPEPDLAERAAVAAHLGGAKATGKTARLAAELSRSTAARPGEVPGSLDILATAGEAERATLIAAAVADALIADEDETIAVRRRKRDLDAASKLERLKADAAGARRRLATLGGPEADPAQSRAAASAQTAAAQARVDAIRAITASGSPPLSDRRDLPSAIESMQSSYLDLVRQLAKARETLGDRHTTIISLQAELRHASDSLTAEWRRLARLAQDRLELAREHEAALRKPETSADAARRESIDTAKRNVQMAEDRVAQALAALREATADETGYRLLVHPAVPTTLVGFSMLARISIGLLVGALVSLIGTLFQTFKTRRFDARASSKSRREPDLVAVADLPHGTPAVAPDDGAPLMRDEPEPVSAGANTSDSAQQETLLTQSMTDLMPRLDSIVPAFGPVPTVMIAANEIGVETTSTSLALGRIAAAHGHRVLVIETSRSRADLAAAADVDGDPLLLDLYGVLRVALRAQASAGVLYLAPSLQQGARIAAALARQGGTPIVDDIGLDFDLIIIDGGRAADTAAAGWGADAYLRVGRFRSNRDDDKLAATFGAPRESLLGAIVDSTFAKEITQAAPQRARGAMPNTRTTQKGSLQANASASCRVRQTPGRRKITAR